MPGEILLPADGIYAGWFERPDGAVHPTAISLGRRPTFYEAAHACLLEAHLLDFDGDLYGEHVKVRFVARLRGEVKFDSVDALVDQIRRDCDEAASDPVLILDRRLSRMCDPVAVDRPHLSRCRRGVGSDHRPGRRRRRPVTIGRAPGRRPPPTKVRHLALAEEPIIGPGLEPDAELDVTLPRLARHPITLADGHKVGVAVCGRGVPLVLVHGFSAEGILYAQTLSRLVDLGLQGDRHRHRRPRRHPRPADRRRQSLASYAELLGRVLDELGIEAQVLAGHSMGGRLVTELAAAEPDRAIAVILLDAIVGRHLGPHGLPVPVLPAAHAGHRRARSWSTRSPPCPWFRDPRQAVKLGRLVAPDDRRPRPPALADARPRRRRSCAPRQPPDAREPRGSTRCRCS